MTEWVLVPREPTAKMVLAAFDAITNASGEGMIRARWRCMLDAAPAAPQQAEPVAWMAFGGALVHAVTRNAMDPIEAERFDVPLYLHPPAAPQQAEPVAQIGWADEFGNLFPMGAWKPAQRTHHDSHKTAWRAVYLHPPAAELARLRAENERLRGDNVHLRGHFERAWPDTQRYRWLRATNMEQRNILAHYAYTEMDAAIDAAMAQGDKA